MERERETHIERVELPDGARETHIERASREWSCLMERERETHIERASREWSWLMERELADGEGSLTREWGGRRTRAAGGQLSAHARTHSALSSWPSGSTTPWSRSTCTPAAAEGGGAGSMGGG